MSGYSEDFARDVYVWTSEDANAVTEKAIYFDMDGTIADLYGVDNWLEKLQNNDPTPYYEAKPLVAPDILWDFCATAVADGFRIGIVSWLSKECNEIYGREIIESKLDWCDEYLPCIDEIVIAPYGTPKSTIVEVKTNSVLIDDECQNRLEWQNIDENRIAYDTVDMLGTLRAIQDQLSAL